MRARVVGIIAAATAAALWLHRRRPPAAAPAHVENTFTFTIAAPLDVAGPLFGAARERDWAGESWRPQFVHPLPPRDIAGAVFNIAHPRSRQATWVNTVFDRDHIQYVYVLPPMQAVIIDIHLQPLGSSTHARVAYRRTALLPRFNRQIVEFGERDRLAGDEWSTQIADYLRRLHPS